MLGQRLTYILVLSGALLVTTFPSPQPGVKKAEMPKPVRDCEHPFHALKQARGNKTSDLAAGCDSL